MSENPSDKPTIKQEKPTGPPQPEELVAHFPQLDILDLLGVGGMGVVYKARQKSLDRIVALKVLPPKPDRDDSFGERFEREARALARLHHPNIVMVYDSGKIDDLYYFIMEYVDGTNLRRLINTEGFKPGDVVDVVPSICEALAYAHEEGIAHRDIKPENILIDKKGRVKIADFGIAKLLQRGSADLTLTSPQQVIGTMNYMAPEQIERPGEVDHRADIYSLGVVFYEMLTGELPIGRFPLPSEKVALDRRLDDIVLRALEKEPDRRYQQATDVKTDLETVTTTGPAPQRPSWMPVEDGFEKRKSLGVAYACWCTAFVGVCGVHRLYMGRLPSGVIWLLTLGLLALGQLLDLLLMPLLIHGTNKRIDARNARRAAAQEATTSASSWTTGASRPR